METTIKKMMSLQSHRPEAIVQQTQALMTNPVTELVEGIWAEHADCQQFASKAWCQIGILLDYVQCRRAACVRPIQVLHNGGEFSSWMLFWGFCMTQRRQSTVMCTQVQASIMTLLYVLHVMYTMRWTAWYAQSLSRSG